MQLSATSPNPLDVRMWFNSPVPVPGDRFGNQRVEVSFTDGPNPSVESIVVSRGQQTYFSKETFWAFGADDRSAFPQLAGKVDAMAPDLVRALQELQANPSEPAAAWQVQGDNRYVVQFGDPFHPGGAFDGRFVGGDDAADAVAKLLDSLASDVRSTVPSFTEGPG